MVTLFCTKVRKKNCLLPNYIVQEIEKDELTFDNEAYQLIFNEIKEQQQDEQAFNAQYFVAHTNEQINEITVDLLTPKHEESKIWTRNGNILESPEMRLKEIVPEAILAF
jgi:hypothetical protein